MDDNLRSGAGVFQRHTDKEVQMLREFNTSLATDNLRSDLVELIEDSYSLPMNYCPACGRKLT